MKELEIIAERYYAPHRDGAVKFNKDLEKKVAVDFEDPDPRFFLRSKDDGDNIFTVRMFRRPVR